MANVWPQDILSAMAEGQMSTVEAIRKLRNMENVSRPTIATEIVHPQQRIEDILHELDSLIGLREVKKLVREIHAFIEIQKMRQKERLIANPVVLHMIFKGNPGTGKTTVARIVGRIFRQMGVLSRGHLIEVERADLVGEYIGHTAQKTREQLKKAQGGILFIDEAYSLARGGEKDFGKEAIDCMVKAMEDKKDEFILILAGYQEEMENFIQTNPGLRSRFPIHMNFTDYNQPELMNIAEQMCLKRQYQLTDPAKLALATMLTAPLGGYSYHFGNARDVRNIIERAIRRQAVRLIAKQHITREELMLLEPGDLQEVTL